ncbi:hypothetical protein CBM2626_B10119 [Cupriavidus taiwanensis]|nr:hypothetical protein CBM2626_B10119 [Cupriavidus taiwanensis]
MLQRRATGPWSALAETGTGCPPDAHPCRRIITQKRVRTSRLPRPTRPFGTQNWVRGENFLCVHLASRGRPDLDLSTSHAPGSRRRNGYAPCCGAETGPMVLLRAAVRRNGYGLTPIIWRTPSQNRVRTKTGLPWAKARKAGRAFTEPQKWVRGREAFPRHVYAGCEY